MGMFRKYVLAIVATFSLLLAVPSGQANDGVLLTVSNPAVQGASGVITFTRQELEALDQRTIRTETEFTDGTKTFEGPRIADILGLIGRADATKLRMVAANDYAVEIDISEIEEFDPIIAMSMDGEPLSIRDKGPLWVMYPLDDYSELQDPVYNSRLIWQLTKIILK